MALTKGTSTDKHSIVDGWRDFRDYYSKQSSIPFFVIFGLFMLSNMLLVINFTADAQANIDSALLVINSILIWLCPMYFLFNLVMWRLKPTTICISFACIVALFLLWNRIGGTNEIFCTVVGTMLALLAYKRNYRTLLKMVMFAHLSAIIFAAIGLKMGYTVPRYKLDTVSYGLSLGLIYPNHLGRMFYIVLTIAWYLWGQKYKIATTIIFWLVAFLMWQYVKCRTIALFMVAFPVFWILTQALLKRNHTGKVWRVLHKIWNGIMTFMPFVCYAASYILGQYRSVLDRLFLGTKAYSLMMRFISAGILFQVYGFPLLGRDILAEGSPMEFMNGKLYVADIIDNAYIYYLIAIGGICLIACMLWLSYANWKCIKNGDHALLLMSVCFLVYGLIEIATFQFEHNFMWFYPLAATAVPLIKQRTGTADQSTTIATPETPVPAITSED